MSVSVRSLLFAGICSGLLVSSAFAVDSVTKKSGGRVGGKITGGSKTELTIKPPTGDAVNIPANDLQLVDFDDATADLKLGLADENAGRFDAALQRVTKSKTDTKGDNALLKGEFDFILARLHARIALADPAKRDEAITLLQGFQKSHSDHYRFYDSVTFLGQVQLAKQDYEAARKSFDVLSQAPWSEAKLAAKIASGRILTGENKLDEAVQNFDDAIKTAGSSAGDTARKYEAMLGKARALIAQSKHAEALTTLDEVTLNASPEDTALQAEAYVLQGNALQSLNRAKEAVLAYLHVDILFPREAGYHAESLYHMTKLWKTVQLPERGLEAEAKLQSSYPNSEWTKKLSTVQN
ncbi:MAG TPA: tetratricopeptide repeat protein [Planctomycetaceae bacterium]|nr:tetratricopeptide repeat protein [Planctomycetaceae bacterium]